MNSYYWSNNHWYWAWHFPLCLVRSPVLLISFCFSWWRKYSSLIDQKRAGVAYTTFMHAQPMVWLCLIVHERVDVFRDSYPQNWKINKRKRWKCPSNQLTWLARHDGRNSKQHRDGSTVGKWTRKSRGLRHVAPRTKSTIILTPLWERVCVC